MLYWNCSKLTLINENPTIVMGHEYEFLTIRIETWLCNVVEAVSKI